MKKYLKNPNMTWTLEKYPELKIEALATTRTALHLGLVPYMFMVYDLL